MESDSWLIILIIAALVALSAFFSASETALTAFNKIRMRKRADEGDRKAAAVLKIVESYDHSLSSILVGNNTVNIVASTLATLLATSLWGPAKGGVAAAVGMTAILLVFGEVLPKNYAKEHAGRTASRVAEPLKFFIRLLSPVSILLTKISRAALRGGARSKKPSITEEELIYMMDAIEEEGVLEEQERELVQSALEFDETSLREILTPRVNIVALDVDEDFDEIKRVVVEQGFSRIPVYEKSVDSIIGVLYTRDFLLGLIEGREMRLKDMLGEALFVHKGMKLSHLLSSFTSKQLNMAVVVDEYGGTLGIVTMEDVLEELVGEIWDEDDVITEGLTETPDGGFEAAGDYSLADLFERLGIEEGEDSPAFNTVGGWALKELGHIPETGEAFKKDGYTFTVLEMEGRRLGTLGIRLESAANENERDKAHEPL